MSVCAPASTHNKKDKILSVAIIIIIFFFIFEKDVKGPNALIITFLHNSFH